MRSLTCFALVSIATTWLASTPATSDAQQSGPCNPVAAAPAATPPSDDWHCPTLGESLTSFSDLIGFPCGTDDANSEAAPCGPTWVATADAIVMQRVSLNGVPIACGSRTDRRC